jgi:acid phosphatase (class A)
MSARAGAVATLFVLAGCASPATVGEAPKAPPKAAPQASSDPPKGYLPREALVDSSPFLPSPPAPGSAAQAADEAAYRAAREFRNTPRWRLAARDSEYRFPLATQAFSCALGVAIDEKDTPEIYTLLRRSFMDSAFVIGQAKVSYKRPNPFIGFNDPICTPELTDAYRRNASSYPSNNAAIGWVWALALSEVAPDRIGVLMRRGYDFGQNRVVCGLHWDTDIEAGRLIGSALFAQLHTSSEYVAQVEAARRELAALRASPGRAPPDCALENEVAGRK